MWEVPRCLHESEEGCSDERRKKAGCSGCIQHSTQIWPLDKETQSIWASQLWDPHLERARPG